MSLGKAAAAPTVAAGPAFCHALAGLDENGLGPRLGPLLVTAVRASATDEGRRIASRKARGKLQELLSDSKKLVAFGDSGLGEAWARAVALRGGLHFASPAELLAHLCLDGAADLEAPCPSGHRDQCWATDTEELAAPEALVQDLARHLDRLASRGLAVEEARLVIVCTSRLNAAVREGRSRFHVDLHAMERLCVDLRARARGPLSAVCGKVGGLDRYGPHFGPFSQGLHSALVEGRDRSEYAVAGLGTVAFVKDADDTYPLVSLASLIGKWARDLLMLRIVRHHRAYDADLPAASGYHDPVTARFVDATRLARARRGLPDDCFERIALGPGATRGAPTPTS